jgi:hypothetical protein
MSSYEETTMSQVYILEAIQSCEDSPVVGKILAFVGDELEKCFEFMDSNSDYIQSEEPDAWHWRVTERTLNAETSQDEIVTEFSLEGAEVSN